MFHPSSSPPFGETPMAVGDALIERAVAVVGEPMAGAVAAAAAQGKN